GLHCRRRFNGLRGHVVWRFSPDASRLPHCRAAVQPAFAPGRAHPETTTKVRRKLAPVAELESSANPQPGKPALRSARFPACEFWRLSSRQMVVLSRCGPIDSRADSRNGKTGARTALSARTLSETRNARTWLSALQS